MNIETFGMNFAECFALCSRGEKVSPFPAFRNRAPFFRSILLCVGAGEKSKLDRLAYVGQHVVTSSW